ncbi:TIGR02996 domain-containing protein [Gemmata algarum]|uniref:TIGR02996 domain-containing protein n=1 Tax=Gemmata algarum TaxID=2975278 RepID=UPI0038B3D2EA
MRERALSDEAAFLGAVRANPGDDTAWFAFADWLDARDDARGCVCLCAWQISRQSV